MKAEASSHTAPPPTTTTTTTTSFFPVNVGFRCSQVTRSPRRQLDHALPPMSFDLSAAFEGHGDGHRHGNTDT